MSEATKSDTLELVAECICRAESSAEPRKVLEEGKILLAEAVLRGEQLDKVRLELFMLQCAKNYQTDGSDRAVLAWAPFLGACADYVREGVVCMGDGRVATAEGWDYSNCEPVEIIATSPERRTSGIGGSCSRVSAPNPLRTPRRRRP